MNVPHVIDVHMVVKIGIIGNGNQSSRLIELIQNRDDSNVNTIFHPSKKSKERTVTNTFSDLFNCDSIIIASPNDTHYDYINQIFQNFSGYIFCEKPPVTSQIQLDDLKKLSKKFKHRLFFNFNYRFSRLNDLIQNNNKSEKIGKILHIDIISTKGLAYKKSYINSWRSKGKENTHSILDNVSIHYIDLLLSHFGKIKNINYFPTSVSKNSASFDTCHLSLQFQKGVLTTIFNSYAAPYLNEITIIGTNGYLKIKDDNITLFSPRDTFDLNNFFISPPISEQIKVSTISDYTKSLKNSLDYFISIVQEKSIFKIDYFNTSIDSNQIILDLHKKIFVKNV